MNAHELLVQGRNRLAKGYLVKGRLSDGGGGFCARGCLWDGPCTPAEVYEAEAFVADVFGVDPMEDPDLRMHPVVDFNNAPETTKDDVVDLLDKAIVASAPQPDLTFLKDVRITPERVS